MADDLNDIALERALERLDAAASDGRPSADPAVAELEVALTLLAHELDPVAPHADARARLLAGARAQAGASARVLPFERPAVAKSRFVPWALAAALAGCALGIVWLTLTVNRLEDRLERQAADLAAAEKSGSEILPVRAAAEISERRLAMITKVARYAYPLRGASASDATPINGVVFVCGHHQQWLLSVEGLAPLDSDHEYRLWFKTPDGPIDGGPLPAPVGGRIAMEDVEMPKGTRAFALTREIKSNDRLAAPRGETVLLGDRSVSL